MFNRSTTVEFRNPRFVVKVQSCYEELRIGNQKIKIIFPSVLKDIEKQLEASGKEQPKIAVKDMATKVIDKPGENF